MSFKLCNAPDTSQGYINELLQEYFNVFCTVYLNNIMIYSTKEENHAGQVRKVLRRLHEQRLQMDMDKCKFLTKKVKYLGMIVTTKGIKMNVKKTDVVQK